MTAYASSEPLFPRLLADSASFRASVFRYLSERIAELMQLVEEAAFGPMDQRLANLLLERGPQVAAMHPMIADKPGTVRKVVSRRLKQLEAAGPTWLDRMVRIVTGFALLRLAIFTGWPWLLVAAAAIVLFAAAHDRCRLWQAVRGRFFPSNSRAGVAASQKATWSNGGLVPGWPVHFLAPGAPAILSGKTDRLRREGQA